MSEYKHLPAADASTMRRLSLRLGASVEQEFRASWLRKSLGQIRATLIVGAVFYGAFGVLDFFLAPSVAPALWAIRFGAIVPLSLALVAFTMLPRFQDLVEPLLALWVLLAGLAIVAMIGVVPGEVGQSYYAGLILVFIVGYTWARIRFSWASIVGWVIVAAYEIVAMGFVDTPTQVLVSNNFFFVGANVLGMLACYSIEWYARKDFLMTRRLREEKAHVREANRALARANRELERLAQVDGLTGIPNRRSFDGALAREWRRAQRSGQPLALIMGDVDHFKLYNDSLGHPAGDECLRRVARALAGQPRRPADLAARYGGEEFAVLLPDTDQAGALHLAERILAITRGLSIPHPASSTGEVVTLSLGVGVLIPRPNHDAAALVRLADEALYEAKEGGRDRVVARTADPGATRTKDCRIKGAGSGERSTAA